MSDSYSNLLYHVVFATKYREPIMKLEDLPRIHKFLGGTLRRLGCVPVAINGIEDHVHLLISLRPDQTVSGLVRDLKSRSAVWIRREIKGLDQFLWQRGYGAFTVSQSGLGPLISYIADQQEHHKKFSSRQEMVALLNKHNINFDSQNL